MRKTRPYNFFFILAAILLIMSLPKAFSEKSRGWIAGIFSPLWKRGADLQGSSHLFAKQDASQQEIQKIRTQKQSLEREIAHLQEIMSQELYLIRSGVQRTNQWQKLLTLYADAVPARVIFRNSSTWNSSCWLDVGQEDNKKLGKRVVAKNSPVVIGYGLVGVIDYVGNKQSRVRLLTDSGLTPSVRASRGNPKQKMLVQQLNTLMDAFIDQETLFSSPEEKMKVIESLERIEKKWQQEASTQYLAKGVVCGGSKPSWRSQGQLLKGSGFNCDFSDELSPARDLQTGGILQPADLLITTGMDGVFPPGLHVGEVTKVFPLKEGDYYYELEARPAAGDLEELSIVYILPPSGYDPEEQPPLMGWE